MKTFPKAETANIVWQKVDKELLLYNLTTDKAFCLNQTSADIYNLCDGTNDVDKIAAKTKLPKEIVQLAVGDLSRQNLLTERIELPTSRRSLLKNIAVTTVALPVVMTLVAPTAAHAVSNRVCVGGTETPGFPLGRYPSNTNPGNGTTVCADPACTRCISGDYDRQISTCENEGCTTVFCYCA